MKQTTIWIEEDALIAFRMGCVQRKTSVSGVIRDLVARTLKEWGLEDTVPQPYPTQHNGAGQVAEEGNDAQAQALVSR